MGADYHFKNMAFLKIENIFNRILQIGIFVFCLTYISCRQTQDISEKIPIDIEPFAFEGKHQPSVMILGVFHFGDNADIRQEKHDADILSKKRQQEIAVLLNMLKEYKPTKIMFESDRIENDSISNVQYKKFLSGEFDISKHRSEEYQIGFRLAKMMKHNRIYCIDAMPWDFCSNVDMESIAGATSYEKVQQSLSTQRQFERLSRYDTKPLENLMDSLKNEMTLVEYFRILNHPKYSEKITGTYLTGWTLTGAGSNYFGADHWANLMRRDIRIFSNVYDISDFDNEERLLLIIGATHVWALKQFFVVSPDFKYFEVNDFLK